MTDSDRNWISNLKVDDVVIVEYRPGMSRNERRVVAKVKRVTKTQILVGTEKTEWKFNYRGQEKGVSTWSFGAILIHPTPARIREVNEENRRLKLAKYMSQVSWEKLSIGSLGRIYEIVKEEGHAKT